jgi:hypothetical protein
LFEGKLSRNSPKKIKNYKNNKFDMSGFRPG